MWRNSVIPEGMDLSPNISRHFKKYYNEILKAQKEEVITLTKLKEELKELEAEKKEIDINDIQRLIEKQKQIDELKQEIKVLESLYKVLSQKPEDVDIKVNVDVEFDDTSGLFEGLEQDNLQNINDFTRDALKAREDIYNQHYNNLFDLFLKSIFLILALVIGIFNFESIIIKVFWVNVFKRFF